MACTYKMLIDGVIDVLDGVKVLTQIGQQGAAILEISAYLP